MAGGFAITPRLANPQALVMYDTISEGIYFSTPVGVNTKSSWNEGISSTPCDIGWLVISFDRNGAGGSAFAFDIAIGPAGSESSGLIISNLLVNSAQWSLEQFAIPVAIPAGSRIAMRGQSDVTSDQIAVHMIGFADSFSGFGCSGMYDTIGGYSGTGAAVGTAIDPGGTGNTMSAYVQLSASTSYDIRGFFLAFDYQNNNAAGVVQGRYLIDIAVGGAGSEQNVITKYAFARSGFNDGSLNDNAMFPPFSPFFWLPVPAGTRISARVQSTRTTATYRTIGVSMYGLRA